MNDPSQPADADRVTTTATPQASLHGRFGRNSLREAQALDSETRTDQVDQMRNLIERTGYRVDSNAVAEAIIARLKAGGAVRDGARNPASSPRPRAR
jgi:anti-sigma28 factor (negative regulator of flagellin synthesis)